MGGNMNRSRGGQVWQGSGTTSSSMCTCVVVVVQHESTTTTSFAPLAPGLENLDQTVVLVPVCITCAPVEIGHSDDMPSLPKQNLSAFQRPAISELHEEGGGWGGGVFRKHRYCRLLLGLGMELL